MKRKKILVTSWSFPAMFSEAFVKDIKTRDCVVRGWTTFLTLSQKSPGFYVSTEQVFWKHFGKSNFSLSHSVFYLFWELFAIFIEFKIVVCKLFEFRRIKYLLFRKDLIECYFMFQSLYKHNWHRHVFRSTSALYAKSLISSHISVNPFPHNDIFWRPWETSLLKTLLEKEKLLITSNFSFSHSVF